MLPAEEEEGLEEDEDEALSLSSTTSSSAMEESDPVGFDCDSAAAGSTAGEDDAARSFCRSSICDQTFEGGGAESGGAGNSFKWCSFEGDEFAAARGCIFEGDGLCRMGCEAAGEEGGNGPATGRKGEVGTEVAPPLFFRGECSEFDGEGSSDGTERSFDGEAAVDEANGGLALWGVPDSAAVVRPDMS